MTTARTSASKPLTHDQVLEYYEVKFEDNGETVYGTVDHYSDDAKLYAKTGFLLIVEMITGKQYVLPPRCVTKIPLDPFPNEYHTQRELRLQAAMERSDAAEDLVGKIFSVGVADGLAWYEVVATDGHSATVAWRGYGCDGYTDQILGWGGKFPFAVIANQVQRFDGMRALFRSPEAAAANEKAHKKGQAKKRKKRKKKRTRREAT